MAKIEIEYRRAELRAATAAFEVAGRAASYNKPSQDLGGFVERLQRGCFTDSLQSGSDVKCLVNHDENQVLGRTLNKTLTLTDTLDGLNFVCALNKDSQAHRDLYASVKRGDLSECSFAFIVDGDDGQDFSSPDTDGLLTRTITRAKLLDVSVVASPAYGNGATSVDARAAVASNQSAIKAQIAAWESGRKQRIADARSRFAQYSPLSAEEIVRCTKLGYSEDLMLELRGAAYARTIRQGFAFEAEPMRYQSGSAEDPTASLRDDDDFDFDDDGAWDKSEHERAAEYHRALARKSSTMDQSVEHYQCADKHDAAARAYPDLNASFAARAASKSLCREKENCL